MQLEKLEKMKFYIMTITQEDLMNIQLNILFEKSIKKYYLIFLYSLINIFKKKLKSLIILNKINFF